MSSTQLEKAIEAVKTHQYSFCKFVSPNDAGETGGHQAGLYIPKNSIQILFDKPGQKGENIEKSAKITWGDGIETEARFIYYGKGTRNEYRITRLGRHFRVDELVILVKLDELSYSGYLLGEKNDIDSFLAEFNLTVYDTNKLISKPSHSLFSPIVTTKPTRDVIDSGLFYIKPAANHILTIGKGIIKDSHTAILELIKNSYDADAENVWIGIRIRSSVQYITIKDDGHGMTYSVITKKWMVPSYSEKLKQKRSPTKKRPLQGRKGIGRYAASILGKNLYLKTTDESSLLTTNLLINWSDFTEDRYLEDIDILIESYRDSTEPQGTYLEIEGEKLWTDKEVDELLVSLKNLLSPFDDIDKDFNIHLEVEIAGSEKYSHYVEEVKPFPILDYYHYRVSGSVKLLGICAEKRDALIANLVLENKHLTDFPDIHEEHEITFRDEEEYCGDLEIDIRAFDLDEGITPSDQIDQELAKQLLKALPGVAVIRDGFRVRPYGERKTDWLDLNSQRFNNPTLRFSSNQVAGFVKVWQEDESLLVEKASREGFKEDTHYEGLRTCVKDCLADLEKLRFNYRKEHNKGGRKKKPIDEVIDDVANLKQLNSNISTILKKASISDSLIKEISDAIDKESTAKQFQYTEIKNTIATYQGQVTLGNLMSHVLHEGRKPLNALNKHPKFISQWSSELLKMYESNSIDWPLLRELLDKIRDRLNNNMSQAQIFVNIFKKLEPLANDKRQKTGQFVLAEVINATFKIFEYDLDVLDISYSVTGDLDTVFIGWEVDFYIAFSNLIENSIYWLNDEKGNRNITVEINDKSDKILIDYLDSGPGIDEKDIATQDIFNLGYTTKKGGTGLGLAITGEVLTRNKGRIRAVSNLEGANFLIELIK